MGIMYYICYNKNKSNMINLTRLSIVINSSLGDALMEMANGDTRAAAHRVAFVKWITFNYRDLNQEVDATALYYEYLEWKS
jgi:hypothetical protein